jgi:hypothetical protein
MLEQFSSLCGIAGAVQGAVFLRKKALERCGFDRLQLKKTAGSDSPKAFFSFSFFRDSLHAGFAAMNKGPRLRVSFTSFDNK